MYTVGNDDLGKPALPSVAKAVNAGVEAGAIAASRAVGVNDAVGTAVLEALRMAAVVASCSAVSRTRAAVVAAKFSACQARAAANAGFSVEGVLVLVLDWVAFHACRARAAIRAGLFSRRSP